MIAPYPHQMNFIDAIRAAFKTNASVMGCAATGFGKTVVSAYIAQAAAAKGNRVIFTVHRDNLVTQTSNTFKEFGVPHGFITAGRKYDGLNHVNIASINTLQRRLHTIEAPSLLVIDEAHLAMAAGWKTVADHYKALGTKILGNSGSPQRLDGKPLSDIFDVMVQGPSVRWLIDNGFLSDYRYYAPDVPDLKRSDFTESKLAAAMDRPKLLGDVVTHYERLAPGKRTVCFCVNVSHSQHTAAAFNQAGIPAAHIDADTSTAERARILEDFADGRILVLCNVELVTTGFDLSAQVGRDVPVEAVILLRPTQSLALHLQMVGRALRRKPYPAIVIDHAGNAHRHGLPDDEREWTLDGRDASGKAANDNGPPPPVTCHGCYAQIRRPAPVCCPYCSTELKREVTPIRVDAGELKEILEAEKQRLQAQRKQEQGMAKTFEELVTLGRKRGIKNPVGWAWNVMGSRGHKRRA